LIKRHYLFSLFIVWSLSGCSVLTSIEDGFVESFDAIEEGFDALVQSFSEADEVDQPIVETDTSPVMETTRKILQTHVEFENTANSEADKIQLPEQKQAENKIIEDLWLRIPDLYQLSDINNLYINKQLKWYLKHKSYFERISKRAEPFLYLITEEVEKRNMPGEIAFLPIVESAFKTDAYSRQKASGLWQFIPATGRYFGLKENWWYDGRRDVYMATDAALTYLSQLNKYYKGDWLLALAAYNAGAGTVDKAIRKNKKKGIKTDYWSLDLPKETRRYIPKLLAVSRLIGQQKKFSLNLYPISNKPYLRLVNTQSQINLSLAAKLSGLSIKAIKTYNPAIKQWATAPDGPHHLLLPVSSIENFTKQLALVSKEERMQWYRHKIKSGENLSLIAQQYNISIKTLKRSNHLNNNRIIAGKYLLVPSPTANQAIIKKIQASSSSRMISYQVKKGDSLYMISRRFNVSINELKKWNSLRTKQYLQPGQKLKVYKQTI